MKLKKLYFLLLLFFLILILILSTTIYINSAYHSIRYVIGSVFNAPDASAAALYFAPDNRAYIGIENPYPQPSQYQQLRDKTYQRFFTNQGYQNFTTQFYDSEYLYICTATNQQIKPNKIKITKSDTVQNKYDFTVEVAFGVDGQLNKTEVATGFAFVKSNKIEAIHINGQIMSRLKEVEENLEFLPK